MKNLKKVFAVIMALAMIFALSVTAFAATTVSTTEDTSVLTLTSTGNTVTYQAVTVDGDENNETITAYTYCVKTANDTASVTITNPQGFVVYLNGSVITNYTFTLNKNSHNSLELVDAFGVFREFDIAVVDSTSVSVSIEINCYNAYYWLLSHTNSQASAGYANLESHLGLNSIGKMSTVVTLTGLPAGSTAMDALYKLKQMKNLTLSGSGSAAGTIQNPVYTYISAIDGLGEGMCGGMSGWCYVKAANNANHYTMPMMAASSYTLTEGEHIIWVYTCNFSDIGTAINATVN